MKIGKDQKIQKHSEVGKNLKKRRWKQGIFGFLLGCSFPMIAFASSGNPGRGAWMIMKDMIEPILYCMIAVGAVRILKDRKITEGILFVIICILAMILIFHPELLKAIADNWAGRL